MLNLGGLDGSVTTLGGRVKLTGKAAGLARRAVYAVSFFWLIRKGNVKIPGHYTAVVNGLPRA